MANVTNNQVNPGFWIGLILVSILLFLTLKCNAQRAQYDTIQCKSQCIKELVKKPNKKGAVRIYALYKDEKNHILDLIPVSDSVYEYIQLCEKYGIPASLGIKLRNKQVYSIIKLPKKYDEE